MTRLDAARMRSEKAEKLGLSEPEIIDGQTLNSTLQRGWYWGSQAFRDRLLKKPERKKGGLETNRTFHSSQQGRDNAEAGARGIIGRGRKWFQISPQKGLNSVQRILTRTSEVPNRRKRKADVWESAPPWRAAWRRNFFDAK